ncbi:MAG: DUF4870 domain-containing protein [Cyanobacteria bacterium P01_G01_bin.54]
MNESDPDEPLVPPKPDRNPIEPNVAPKMDPEDERLVAMFCHVSSLLWLPLIILGIPIPFANVFIPLLIWLLQREKSVFVDRHGREALNFQISMLLYSVVLIILGVVVAVVFFNVFDISDLFEGRQTTVYAFTWLALSYGSFLLFWGVTQLVLTIWAGAWAQRGRKFRYPLTIRFLRPPQTH